MGKGLLTIAASALLLVGGAAYAIASAGGGGQITACVTKKTGVLYVGKCKKHARKLTWNALGPTGPRGPTGATGQTGPQGPGEKIFTFDAAATSSPQPTTLGTVAGDTFLAECATHSGGGGSVKLLLQTTDGSYTADSTTLTEDNLGTHDPQIGRTQDPAGFLSTPTTFTQLQLTAANAHITDSTSSTQTKPEGAETRWQLDVATDGSDQATCHVSVLAVPASVASATG